MRANSFVNESVTGAVVVMLALALAGCTMHSTDSTEVGVLTQKISILGKPGIQQETYAPGATYFFPAMMTDWSVFNVALQNLEMVADKARGDREGRDDLAFKTHDG
jgi:hypothetical protein